MVVARFRSLGAVTDRGDDLDTLLSGDGGGDERAEGRRDRRLLLWVIGGLVVVLGGLYLAGYLFAGNRLPQDTTIQGVQVGGMSPERAERVLARELDDVVAPEIQVVAGDKEFTLDPDAVGVEVDVPASVAQVPVGRSWNPADMWENLVGGEEYAAVVVSRDGLLADRLDEIAEEVGTEPVVGGVKFSSEGAEPVYPEPGAELDVDAAADEVRAAYISGEGTAELTLDETHGPIDRAEVDRAMNDVANPAMSGPVTYVIGGEQVVLRPDAYAAALRMRPEGNRLELQVRRKKLIGVFEPAMRTIAEQPQDATFRIVDGKPQVVPAKKGVTVDFDRVVRTFPDLVVASGEGRTETMDAVPEEPELTTAEARELGVEEMVSEFTTYYPHAEYRNVNIGRAAELVDGTLLLPGETFSLNDTVGERTRENGFTEGYVISDGILKQDLGGGVSQMATTLFNAMFFAGLEDVEHKAHSFYIDRYPVGREATVAWPVVDLKFKNDTDHGVFITASINPSTYSSSGSVTVRMWSTKIWDIESITGERYAFTSPETRYLTDDDCEPHTGYGGFSIKVTRVFRPAGSSEVDRREVFTTVYTPSDSVVCAPAPTG